MKVLIRADAGPAIGSGHVMRCMTLARALTDAVISGGGKADITLAFRQSLPGLDQMIIQAGCTSFDLGRHMGPPAEAGLDKWSPAQQEQDAHACLDHLGPQDLVIVDHYGLDISWQRIARRAGSVLLAVDDLADRTHCADIIVDQTIRPDGDPYTHLNTVAGTHLVGPRYTLLRPEFGQTGDGSARVSTDNPLRWNRVLISLGGMLQADVLHHVLDCVAQSQRSPDFHFTVVGGLSADTSTADTLKTRCTDQGVDWIDFVGDMPGFLAGFGRSIGAGGVSLLERCALGLPSLAIILADNQRGFAQAVAKAGAVHAALEPEAVTAARLDDFLNLTHSDLMDISDSARRLCDGKGTQRVVRAVFDATRTCAKGIHGKERPQ